MTSVLVDRTDPDGILEPHLFIPYWHHRAGVESPPASWKDGLPPTATARPSSLPAGSE